MERGKIYGGNIIDMFRGITEVDANAIKEDITNNYKLLAFQDFLERYISDIIKCLYNEYPIAPEKANYINKIAIEETYEQTKVRLENIRFWLILIDNSLRFLKISKEKESEIKDKFVSYDFIPMKRSLMRFKAYLMSEDRRFIVRPSTEE